MMSKFRRADIKTIHRDFLGAHRYTTRGGTCVLRRPLQGAGCLTLSAIRGNNLSPSLRYPFMYFASVEALKSRASPYTKSDIPASASYQQKGRWAYGG